MNKKKVKELIKKAISELNTTDIGILCTQSTLEETAKLVGTTNKWKGDNE